MANPLTGDFEAVLQVSGGTINRLVATMHQNSFTNPKLPSFPHSVRMRMGDDHAFEGVRGLVHGQIGVPRIKLIHGVTDRFHLEVGIRAWFRPDPGTAPMPAFIHGKVSAEYRVQDIKPSCVGWSKNAADFLWIRVVRDSVRFEGTADDDTSMTNVIVGVVTGDPDAIEAANVAKVTRQAARLLAKRFEATPHLVSERFRRGAMRSLNAPIGGSAVALPISLSGAPLGDINSIDNLLLEGSDLAIGVSRDYVMSLTWPMQEKVKDIHPTVSFYVDTGTYNPIPNFTVVYHSGVNPPVVTWEPHDSYAAFKVEVHGWATTSNPWMADATFDVTMYVVLDFNGVDSNGNRQLQLTPLKPGVKVHSSGLASGLVADEVQKAILKIVPPVAQAACDQARPALDAMITQTAGLTTQLRQLDGNAWVSLDEGLFLRDGIIIRGAIGLSSRHAPVVTTAKTAAEDAHTALDSWIPGGRIDRLEWSWSWFGSGEPGTASFTTRFLLRRPWGNVGRWGVSIGADMPLPGLDGWGTVCLKISGVRVDSVTGGFVAVSSTKQCKRFGYNLVEQIGKGDRLFLRDMPELSKDVPFPQLKDLPLVATRSGRDTVGATNTLVLYVDEQWNGETAETLAAGLDACRRYDAGLTVLILFREGLLERDGARLVEEIGRLARKVGIATHINEDVNGGWSRALDLRAGSGEPGWAIVSPDGNALWTHPGRLQADGLAAALDTHLRRCPDHRPVAYHSGINIGAVISSAALHPGIREIGDLLDTEESPCPPIPLGRMGRRETVVTFVQGRSAASVKHLRKLASQHAEQEGQQSAIIVAVFDRTDQREAEALKDELGLDVIAVADPQGRINDRFGVGVWPTTITLDRGGVVADIQLGIARRPERAVPGPDGGAAAAE